MRQPDAVIFDPERLSTPLDNRLGNRGYLRIYSGMQWTEGPAWNRTGNRLIWRDTQMIGNCAVSMKVIR